MRGKGGLDPTIEAELDRERLIRPIPSPARTRILGRARAFVAAEALGRMVVVAPTAPSRTRRFRIAVAASMTLLLGVAGATAAILVRGTHGASPIHVVPMPPVSQQRPIVKEAARETPNDGAGLHMSPKRRRLAHVSISPRESYAAELQLLQRAQVAYKEHDFLGTLLLVAEHGRHFLNGRLAEEREALRVRSLVALGRREEARLVIATFRVRFPRSVLLPGLRDAAGSSGVGSDFAATN